MAPCVVLRPHASHVRVTCLAAIPPTPNPVHDVQLLATGALSGSERIVRQTRVQQLPTPIEANSTAGTHYDPGLWPSRWRMDHRESDYRNSFCNFAVR
jgi:hypothetical protein